MSTFFNKRFQYEFIHKTEALEQGTYKVLCGSGARRQRYANVAGPGVVRLQLCTLAMLQGIIVHCILERAYLPEICGAFTAVPVQPQVHKAIATHDVTPEFEIFRVPVLLLVYAALDDLVGGE